MHHFLFKIACGAIAFSCTAACASSSQPPPENASSAAAEPSDEELVAQAKQMLHGSICGSDSPLRACLVIPDDGACAAAFDEAWPDCDGGFVNLHEGDAEHWEKVGGDTARCVGERLKARFPLANTVEQVQACANLVAAANAQP